MREDRTGEIVGDRYELVAPIGRGGMADVYRATDRRLERDVAIKIFRADLAEAIDPQRTGRETHLLGGVSHPTVVGVLDASDDDAPVPYLVMELVEGDDLGSLLAAGPVPPDLVRRIVADVADALALLHSRSVVHRDVKPANILVLAEAERGRTGVTAKLTDFGIAHLVDGTRLTTSDSILGTAAYLSPEQVRGATVGPASDVYSLGLVLIECLSGVRAFPGPAPEAAVARLARPPAIPGTASAALAGLLSRMTALDPDARPAAEDVAAALRGELVGAMTAPESLSTAPVPVAALAAAAAAPVAAAAADPVEAAEPEAEPAPRRRHPLRTPAIAAAAIAAVAGLGALVTATTLHGVPFASAPIASAPLAPGPTAGSTRGAAGDTAAPATSTPTSDAPASAAPSSSASRAASSSPSPSPSPSASPSPSPTPTHSPTPSPSAPSPSASPSPSPSAPARSTPPSTPPSISASPQPSPRSSR